MNAETLAKGLGGRKSGARWMARCPAHPDNNPSLSIDDSRGKLLVCCHAGCSQTAVLGALRAKGLWTPRPTKRSRRLGPIVQTYNYTDESGNLLYQVCRHEPKNFTQRRPDRFGGWIWKKSPRQVLYRLQEVLSAPIVFLVEGEKDVETLRAHGFVATTNAGGAKATWLSEYTEALAGREVIVIPDNDKPGLNRSAHTARSLCGRVPRLNILRLDGAKDVTEWFENGHGEVELIALVETGLVRG